MEDIIQVLRDFEEATRGHWRYAHNYYLDDHTRRNELAMQAAQDHRNRAENLLVNYQRSGSPDALKTELRAGRDHAEKWESDFWEKARTSEHDNSYAACVHQMCAEGYRGCLTKLDKMDLDIKPSGVPAVSSLRLLFGTDGHEDGKYVEELTINEGYECTFELSSELSASVTAKASVAAAFLGNTFSGELGTEMASKVLSANTYKLSKLTERKVRMEVNLSKPCYVYQLHTEVQLNIGRPVTLWGGYFTSSKLIAGTNKASFHSHFRLLLQIATYVYLRDFVRRFAGRPAIDDNVIHIHLDAQGMIPAEL